MNQFFYIIIWYFVIQIIGFLTLPLTIKICNRLKNYGYPISKILGLVLFSYISYVLSSFYIDACSGKLSIILMTGIFFIFLWLEKKSLKIFYQKQKKIS